MVPLLGGTIGFLPAFAALTLYSILPTLRNTVTGITELDPAIVEAAHGVGMTAQQRLWRVELPLAAPVIVAGIRTATVWVVGTATLGNAGRRAEPGKLHLCGPANAQLDLGPVRLRFRRGARDYPRPNYPRD